MKMVTGEVILTHGRRRERLGIRVRLQNGTPAPTPSSDSKTENKEELT